MSYVGNVQKTGVENGIINNYVWKTIRTTCTIICFTITIKPPGRPPFVDKGTVCKWKEIIWAWKKIK